MAQRPLLLGHRGARATKSVPENTHASFDLALQHGCDGFEFDVRLTGCGSAVICHDPETGGVTIAEAPCEQIEHLPELSGVLKKYASRAFLDIELKVAGLESQILMALQEHPPQRGYFVSSFLPDVVTELRIRSADILLGFICDRRKHLDHWRELPVQYIVPEHSLITLDLVNEVHEAGKQIFTWTVNDAGAMDRLAGWGVDGIISDNTELVVRTLKK
jgi:glycerophosphoryl diester phosphodiesterase